MGVDVRARVGASGNLILDRRLLMGGAAATGLLLATRAAAAGDEPEAVTASGRVRGFMDGGAAVFRGIPYGAPTGGGSRFVPADPPKNWGGTRECRKFGDQCPQLTPHGPAAWASWAVNVGETEDCLSLNVTTPAVGEGKRPVMVWLHGGGYSEYNGSSPAYDGVRLATRGDVVVVTVNHRLNVFGYLYLGDLAGPKFADSGNIGQLDLVMALQWVRDNIANFGGDPGRVTIFGESGGGGKVSTLLAMPAAKGLFHRAAIQSGPGLTGISREAATATATALCEALHVNPKNADDLQRVPTNRLLDALETLTKAGQAHLGPVVDGRTLPSDPFTPGAPTISAEVPVIVGYNATETTVLGATPAQFDLDWAGLKSQLAPVAGDNADKLIADFRRLRPAASPSDLYFRITTLHGMGARTIALAERKAALAAAGAYLYRLDFETPVDKLRSPHALDIPLVFDTVGKSTSLLGPVSEAAQSVADQMSAAWIAFAHTGSPNGTGLASWPRYDPRARSTMVFNVTSRAVNDPNAEERQLIGALPPTHVG
jgi:para-nitrobenzyl esterase